MHSIPEALLTGLESATGFNKEAFLLAHESGNALTSIRLHVHKNFPVTAVDWETVGRVPWCDTGRYLKSRPSFTADPLFHAGCYYVQEASSMFLGHAVKHSCAVSDGLKVLDLCAAPGGKSTHLLSLLPENCLLVSNEVIRQRVNVLTENISKWGSAHVLVTHNDPKDFQRLPGFFDLIVVDAPCSGSGLFRKDQEASTLWSEDLVALCSQRQRRILADVLPCLKENGVLIYSTCSYSVEEDEQNADWLVSEAGMESVSIPIDNGWGIKETCSIGSAAVGYRFYPDQVAGEGFYLAAFKKVTAVKEKPVDKKSKTLEPVSKPALTALSHRISFPQTYNLAVWDTQLLMLPTAMMESIAKLQQHLYIRKAGTKIGALIREELIPDHDLAMSYVIQSNFPVIEVNKETALQYLRCAALSLPEQGKGWALLQYAGINLGWIKSMPGRVNNYYPKDWRILNK